MATQVRRQVNRNAYANNSYVYGNTVTKPDVRRQFEEPRKKTLSNQARKNREKAKYMSLGYIAFLLMAFSVAAVVLIGYVRLNAEITTLNEEIARQEELLSEEEESNGLLTFGATLFIVIIWLFAAFSCFRTGSIKKWS